MSDNKPDIAYLEVLLSCIICIIYIFVSLAIHYYKETYHVPPWIHESSIACLIGVLMGCMIKYNTGNIIHYIVIIIHSMI